MSPHVMYGSAVLFLGLSRGIGSCIYYVGALQYTTLIFGFSSLCIPRQDVYKDATTVYNVFTYLLLLYIHIITTPCIDT